MDEMQVELKYQGPTQGPFRVTAPSGQVYRVDGRGDQFLVTPDDATWFEETFRRHGQEYVRVARQGAQDVPPTRAQRG